MEDESGVLGSAVEGEEASAVSACGELLESSLGGPGGEKMERAPREEGV